MTDVDAYQRLIRLADQTSLTCAAQSGEGIVCDKTPGHGPNHHNQDTEDLGLVDVAWWSDDEDERNLASPWTDELLNLWRETVEVPR